MKALETQAKELAKQAKERAEDASVPSDLVAQVTEGLIDSPRTWKDEIARLVECPGNDE